MPRFAGELSFVELLWFSVNMANDLVGWVNQVAGQMGWAKKWAILNGFKNRSANRVVGKSSGLWPTCIYT